MTRAPPSATTAVVAGVLMLVTVMGIGRFAYTPLLPRMRDALDWSLATAGDVASANFVGYLLGALIAGPLAARRQRATWLAVALVSSALTTLAGGHAWPLPGWLVLRFVAGFASALGIVIGVALVIDYVIRLGKPSLATGPFPGVGIGIVLSVLVTEAVAWQGVDVFGQWAALGLVAMACTCVALAILWRLPNRVPAEPLPGHVATRLAATPALRRLIASYGLLGLGYVVTATFLVAMARKLPQAALIEPLCWIVVGATAAPSVPLVRRLAARYGNMAVMRGAFLLQATGVLLAGWQVGVVAILLGGACLGATFLSITALVLNAARAEAGAHAELAIGWMTASFGFGQLLGPFIAGRLAQASGGFGAPSAMAAVALVLGALLLPRPPATAGPRGAMENAGA